MEGNIYMATTAHLKTPVFRSFQLNNRLSNENSVNMNINIVVDCSIPAQDVIDHALIRFSINYLDSTNEVPLLELSVIAEFEADFEESFKREDAQQIVNECIPRAYRKLSERFDQFMSSVGFSNLKLPEDFLNNFSQ